MNPESEARKCVDWNRRHQIGTEVEYHSVIGDTKPGVRYKTRSSAELLSGHTAVVWLEGKSGCVALDACVPVERAEAA